MLLPDAVRLQAELLLLAYCQTGVPGSRSNEVRLAFRTRENRITLYECYGPWNPSFPKSSRSPVAQFRYMPERQTWVLYWADNKQKWHPYDQLSPTTDVPRLIAELSDDPHGRFFGERQSAP